MIYFISGHRNLSYEDFCKYYKSKIDEVVQRDEHAEFVVGDCEGVDKFAMDYIYKNCFAPLAVYHMFDTPRNVPEGVNFYGDSSVEGVYFNGGYESDIERDTAMTKASDFDIAFIKDNRWRSGTTQNILRRHGILCRV